MNKKRIGEEKSREEKAGMESVCRAAGLLIAALLAYEAGKLLTGWRAFSCSLGEGFLFI